MFEPMTWPDHEPEFSEQLKAVRDQRLRSNPTGYTAVPWAPAGSGRQVYWSVFGPVTGTYPDGMPVRRQDCLVLNQPCDLPPNVSLSPIPILLSQAMAEALVAWVNMHHQMPGPAHPTPCNATPTPLAAPSCSH